MVLIIDVMRRPEKHPGKSAVELLQDFRQYRRPGSLDFLDEHVDMLIDLANELIQNQELADDAYQLGRLARFREIMDKLHLASQVMLVRSLREHDKSEKPFVSDDPDLTDTDEDGASEDAALMRTVLYARYRMNKRNKPPKQ